MSLTKGTVHLEIHFLELPKVTRTDIRQMRTLDKWMAFIGNKLSNEEMEEIAMSEAAINMVYCTQGCGHTERRDGVKPWQNAVPKKMILGNVNPFSWTDPDAGNCRYV